jgi:hypothetical protein
LRVGGDEVVDDDGEDGAGYGLVGCQAAHRDVEVLDQEYGWKAAE